MAANKPKHILDGIKVLDITNVIAGPSVGNLLVELGADVIKVEMSPTGDRARFIDAIKPGRGTTFVKNNRGKKSLLLDLKQPAAQAIVKDLIPQIDVFVENFAPGAIAPHGFGLRRGQGDQSQDHNVFGVRLRPDRAAGQRARLRLYRRVLCGRARRTRRRARRRADDAQRRDRRRDGERACAPPRSATPCTIANAPGVGQYLDISLLDSYFYVHDRGVIRHKLSGGKYRHEAHRQASPTTSCRRESSRAEKHYLCFMVALDKVWGNLCKAMGKPELGRHPDFATNAKRCENQEQVIKLVQDWLDATPEEEVLRLLDEYHVPAGPLLNVGEAVEHPHMLQRGTVRPVHDPVLGDIELPGPPMRFSEFPDPVDVPAAPNLGEHNTLILKEYLGYSDEKIKQLEEQGLFRKKG